MLLRSFSVLLRFPVSSLSSAMTWCVCGCSALRVRGKERAVSVGTVVQCGDLVRLQHASTKRWLHSHLHASPLTHRQEISGYGEDGGAGSDTGDNWKLECVCVV
jgi:dolichyl-phosphate-mannose--protein O-mannosyl transferase